MSTESQLASKWAFKADGREASTYPSTGASASSIASGLLSRKPSINRSISLLVSPPSKSNSSKKSAEVSTATSCISPFFFSSSSGAPSNQSGSDGAKPRFLNSLDASFRTRSSSASSPPRKLKRQEQVVQLLLIALALLQERCDHL